MSFTVTPAQLLKLVDPKSKDELQALGGVKGLLNSLKTDAKMGLPAKEAANNFVERSAFYGRNVLPEKDSKSFFELVWEGLQDKTLIMLMVASVISLILGIREDPTSGWIEGTAILVAVFTVVNVTAANDYSKERQFRALNAKKENKLIKVIRNGEQMQVSVYELRVGDIVTVETGDIIPADGVFVSGHGIKCDESGVTGESDAIAKPDDDPFFLSGTQVLEGYGSMVVIAVGVNSVHGRTLMALQVESEDTPLQHRLDKLADQIGHFGLLMAALTVIFLIVKHVLLDYLAGTAIFDAEFFSALVKYIITAVTMLVVAVPEGLPLAVTMALAYSMMKMLEDNNLVRHLAACETMGGATTICSDKTGTLTQNRMTVVEGNVCGITFSSSYEPLKTMSKNVHEILNSNVALNSTAYEGKTAKGTIEFIGNKTESALLNMTKTLGSDYAAIRSKSEIVELIPFTSERKSMGAVQKLGDKKFRIHMKGASEMVLRTCNKQLGSDGEVRTLTIDQIAKLESYIDSLARKALRTLCLAYRDVDGDHGHSKWQDLSRSDLVLIGVVGIEDPLREEVADAVATCQRAGIVVRMVTGDNKVTAMNIAKNCGIYKEGAGQIVIEGPEFRKLSPARMNEIIPNLVVLARSSPVDKQTLVDALKRSGEVVAVTGDGTNDGPALKLAHVGFSMGITGTEVAKEASDIILMDDNFSSIVKAVMWGRNVFDSIRKFLQFQLTVNLVAVTLAFIGSLTDAGGESPLRPVQLLWVNLIMDTMAALALATEAPTKELLNRKPLGQDASLITPKMWKHVIGQGIFQLLVNFGLLYLSPGILHIQSHSVRHLTIFFNTFVLCQVFNEINARRINDELNVFSNLFNNKIFLGVIVFTITVQFLLVQFAGDFAGTEALSLHDWLLCFGIGALSLPIGFVLRAVPFENFFVKKKQPKKLAALLKKHKSTIIPPASPASRWNTAIRHVVMQRSVVAFLRKNRRKGSENSLNSHKKSD